MSDDEFETLQPLAVAKLFQKIVEKNEVSGMDETVLFCALWMTVCTAWCQGEYSDSWETGD